MAASCSAGGRRHHSHRRCRHAPGRPRRWPGDHLDRLQHCVRRDVPLGPQPVESLGAERVDRDHGDRHGPHHRVAQHRPVGRCIAGVHRLHDGHGPDAVDPGRPRPGPRASADVDHHPGARPGARRPAGWHPGLRHRLRRSPIVHRHPRRLARVARAHLPVRAGPDHRPARHHLPFPGRGTAGLAWRVRKLGTRRRRLRRHRHRPAAQPAEGEPRTGSRCGRPGP